MSCIQDGYCLSSVFLAALDAMGRCWCGEISTDGGAAASTPHPPFSWCQSEMDSLASAMIMNTKTSFVNQGTFL
jgi:hypothetical protein